MSRAPGSRLASLRVILPLTLPTLLLLWLAAWPPESRGAPPPATAGATRPTRAPAQVAAARPELPPVAAEQAPAESRRLPLGKDLRLLGKKISGHFHGQPGRRIHVQLDKPMYRPGETIWIKSWDLRNFDLVGKASEEPTGVRYELVSPRGDVVQRKEVRESAGLAHNEFALGAELAGGEYTVRAVARDGVRGERTLVVAGFEAPRLKMKLEFVRKAYSAGDEVRATFELRRATGQALGGHPARGLARIDGVDLGPIAISTDARGDALVRFRLPGSIRQGDGLLTVLVDDGGVTESISRRIPIVVKALKLSLHPEGGDLVEEVPSRVYFEAQDPFGKPADVEGHVEDERGQVVARFRSHKNGLGRFGLRPERDRRYTAVVTAPEPARSRHPLPAARGEGCVLRTYDDLDGQLTSLRVGVRCSRARVVTVVGMAREYLMDAARVAVPAGAQATVHLRPPAGVARAQGVARVTLFGEQLEPLAERIVYRNRRQRLRISIKPDRGSYGPRDQVRLTVRTSTADGRPVASEVALSVVDDTVIAFADDKQGHMLSRLLLEPELAGRVEEPNLFLDLTKPESALALDLLLGTRGWRRFEWQPVLSWEPPPPEPRVSRVSRPAVRVSAGGGAGYRVRLGAVAARVDALKETVRRAHARPAPGGNARDAKGGGKALQLEGAPGIGAAAKPRPAATPIAPPTEPAVARPAPVAAGPVAKRLAPRDAKVPAGVERERALAPEVVAAAPAEVPPAAVAKAPPPPPGWGGLGRGRHRIVVNHANITILDRLYFRAGSAQVQARSLPVLDAVAGALRGNADLTGIDIEGHLDAEESRASPRLARQRASAVRAYLVAKGIAPGRLRIKAFGATRPIDTNASVKGRERNRRVEFRIAQRGDAHHGFTPARVFPVPDYRGQPASVRNDFRETVFWEPSLKTGADGRAQVRFTLSDAVTSFRVTAEGIVGHGRAALGLLGRTEHVFRSDRPLSLNARLPQEVSAGDELLLPVTVSSERSEPVEVKTSCEHDGQLAPARPFPEGRRRLAAGGRDTVYYALKVIGQQGKSQLRVSASGGGHADEVKRELSITPVGFPQVASRSGTVGDRGQRVGETVDVGQVVRGSVMAQLQVYPSPAATMVGGLEGLLREPHGCFEQASSSNYPNVMLLAYLKQQRINDPPLLARASKLIDAGYKKLVGYESRSRGYEWFGADPAHEALTAYGLAQFVDMKRIFPVERTMLGRTVTWLRGRRDGKGGFQTNPRALDSFGRASPEVTNAYIIHSLSEAGELDQGFASELAMQRQLAQTARDPYLLALAASTLLNLPAERPAGVAAARRLGTLQSRSGPDAGALLGANHSITRSSGKNLHIETTALAITAFVKAGLPGEARSAVEWLQKNRGGFGQWGATQATVLALKALTRYAESSARTQAPGAVQVLVNGRAVARVAYAAGHREPLIFAGLGDRFASGQNRIEVVSESREPLPYALAVEYRSSSPASSSESPVTLTTQLARKSARLGEVVRLEATLTNRKQGGQPMTMARIGLPGGLTFQTWQLKELRDRGVVAFYETRPREVILYFRQMLPGEVKRIPLELQAVVPGRYTGPASSAYLYYSDEHKSWAAPLQIQIQP